MKLLILSATFITVSLCCQLKDFLPCIMQLTAQKVDFQVNPMDVVSNLTTEAKLMHACRTYGRVLPCFDQKTLPCGTDAQKLQLERGKKLHNFLCSPFSMHRQKIFLRSIHCIKNVLSEPQTPDCNLNGTVFADRLNSCKDSCSNSSCEKKIEQSKVLSCIHTKIQDRCGYETADFYGQMQRVLFDNNYPVQCRYDSKQTFHELKRGLPVEMISIPTSTARTTLITVHPPQLSVVDGVVTKMSFPIMRRTDPNSKSRPRPTTTHSALPIIKTVFVNEHASVFTTPLAKSMMPPTSTSRPFVTHKFIPNPYATRIPNNMKNDQVRTTRTAAFPTLRTNDNNNQNDGSQWSFKNGEQATTPTNGHTVKQDNRKTESALSAPPMAFNFQLPPDESSTQPFRVEINWMDDVAKEHPTPPVGRYVSPWYLKSTPSIRPPEEEIPETFHPNPLLENLNHQSLNLTELGVQANNYFSAALNAFSETKKEMAQHDPWRTLIDAVAPTIQKVSPDIIPRIREEINRIQPGKH